MRPGDTRAGVGPGDDRDLKARVHRRLVAAPDVADSLVTDPLALRRHLAELLRDEEPLLVGDRFERLLLELRHEVGGLGALEPLLSDPSVTEVMVNGPGRVWVERAGRLERVPLDLDAAGIARVVERVLAPLGLRLDRASPMVDARLVDGSRLHAVLPPLAVDGPYVTIRRFSGARLGLEAFGVGAEAAALLRWAVVAGWTLLVAGGTGAGKTTLLGALSGAIPPDERIVTIEETAELRLDAEHVVRLEAHPHNAEGAGGTTVRELVRTALRMRPDRLVVGETRGAEALDLLQALNTGHDGSMSTIHANSAPDALARLETLALSAGVGLPLVAVRAQVASAVDAVVFVRRGAGGARVVDLIAEVDPDEAAGIRALFVREGGSLVAVGGPRRRPRRPEAPAAPVVPAGPAGRP